MDSTAARVVIDRFLRRYPDSIYNFLVMTEGNNIMIEVTEQLHQFAEAGEILEEIK